MKNKIHFLLGFFSVAGCVSPPSYDIKPKIEFISLSREFISQQDSVRIEFSYTDGDGDLGFESPDTMRCNLCDSSCFSHPTFSLFLTDMRTNCLSLFHIPYIPPKGSSEAISGKINFVKSGICCISPSNEVCIPMPAYPYDTVRYTIQLKDRAGNFSNTIEIPPIIIQCN